MYKSRKELEELGKLDPTGPLNYVGLSLDTWESTEVNAPILEKALNHLETTNRNITEKWLSTENARAYQQAYDKAQKYIDAIKMILSEQNMDSVKASLYMREVEEKVSGLSKNWQESPLDQAIPPVLENYIYIRSAFKNTAGF
jgi:uncharacterized coiled-coil protein SlyX